MTDKRKTGGDLNAIVAVAEAANERAKALFHAETDPPIGSAVSLHDLILDSESLAEDARVAARAADDILREAHRNREPDTIRMTGDLENRAAAAGILADSAADYLTSKIKRLKDFRETVEKTP